MRKINEIPPDSVSTQQLLMMVRELRTERRAGSEFDALWRNEMKGSLDGLREEMKVMSAVFEQGKATIRVLKWFAAIATGVVAMYEAIRRLT